MCALKLLLLGTCPFEFRRANGIIKFSRFSCGRIIQENIYILKREFKWKFQTANFSSYIKCAKQLRSPIKNFRSIY